MFTFITCLLINTDLELSDRFVIFILFYIYGSVCQASLPRILCNSFIPQENNMYQMVQVHTHKAQMSLFPKRHF